MTPQPCMTHLHITAARIERMTAVDRFRMIAEHWGYEEIIAALHSRYL